MVKASDILKTGGVAVLLTDTLYGLTGQALNKKTVERIYKIKGRDSKKPFIILISSLEDLKTFGIKVDGEIETSLNKVWPGPVSVILPCKSERFKYLHRGTRSLAFRLPQKKSLLEILKTTGPLVAPSANPQALPPAQNINEAKKYFGENVDFYLKGSRPKNKHSQIIKINSGKVEVIR